MPAQPIALARVNLALPRHASDFMLLLEHYARDPMGGGEALSGFTRTHLVDELRQAPTFVALLAYMGETPVGMVDGFFSVSTFAARPLLNIHDLVVHADFRGKGIGRALLQGMEDAARERRCCKLTLEVLSGNLTALAAYRRFGFADYELDPAAGQARFMQKRL